MNAEENYSRKGDLKPRRSSILKRQDTCVISEDGDDGCRTPRRVSFATNTMIKEFYSVPWSSHDDSSLHSSKSSQSSSSSSSEDALESTLSEAQSQPALSKGYSLSSNRAAVSTVMQELELGNQSVRFHETSIVQDKTIHFQDMDGSIGDMNLTTNVMEQSTSAYHMKDSEIGRSSGVSWMNQELVSVFGESDWQNQVISNSDNTLECLTREDHEQMQLTHNIGSGFEVAPSVANYRPYSELSLLERNGPAQEYTEDMELTADVMFSSQAALRDITDSKVTFKHTAKRPLMQGNAVPIEDQENNPLLILQTTQAKLGASVTPHSVMKPSSMEFSRDRAEKPLANDSPSHFPFTSGTGARNLFSNTIEGSGVTSDDSLTDGISRGEVSTKHKENPVVIEVKQRSRPSAQLTAQILSPVVEMSGLNNLWQLGQVNSSLDRSSVTSPLNRSSVTSTSLGPVTAGLQIPQSNSQELQQNDKPSAAFKVDEVIHPQEPYSKTVYFSSFPTESNIGDMEVTKNLTSNLQSEPMVTAISSKQGVAANQSLQLDGSRLNKLEPVTKTIYFDSADAFEDHITGNDGGMELTKTCSTSHIDIGTSASWITGIHQQRQPSSRPEDSPNHKSDCDSEMPQHSVKGEQHTKTIYFGSEGATKLCGDMELTEAVPFCDQGDFEAEDDTDDDPEIVFNYANSPFLPGQGVCPPSIVQDSVVVSRDQSRSGNRSQTGVSINKIKAQKELVVNTPNLSKSFVENRNCPEKNLCTNSSSDFKLAKDSGKENSRVGEGRYIELHDKIGDQSSLNSASFQTKTSGNESMHAPARNLESSSQPNEHSDLEVLAQHVLGSPKKIGQIDVGVKKKEAVKNNLMKEMGNFLKLSRRTSSTFSMLNPRKSLGGLLLASQDRDNRYKKETSPSKWQPTTPIDRLSNVSSNAEDEVDGVIGSSIRNGSYNRLFHDSNSASVSSAIVSALNERNLLSVASPVNKTHPSDVVSVFDKTNSVIMKDKSSSMMGSASTPSKAKTQLSAPGLNETNSCLVSPAVKNSSALFAETHRNSLSSTPNEKISLELNGRSILSLVSHPSKRAEAKCPDSVFMCDELNQGPDVLSNEEPQSDEADITEHEMLDLTEDLNVQNFLGQCAVDDEAAEDFFRNVESVMSKSVPAGPAPQKRPFSLSEMYSLVGHDNASVGSSEGLQEEISPQVVGNSIITRKLHGKIAVVPKIETLQQFIKSMESVVNKLREENRKTLEMATEDLSKVSSLLTQDTDNNLRSTALKMCKTCRMSSRTKWRKYEADHLFEYSALRESSLEKFNSDVEFFKKDAEKCVDGVNQFDKCLQEIELIQKVNKELRQQEINLSRANDEARHLKQKSDEYDDQVRSIKETSEELICLTERTVAAQEDVEDQLSWLESLTEWTLLQQSDQEMHFGFLFKTLVLQISFNDCPSSRERRISNITLKSRLAGASKPWAKLSHRLAVSSIDCNTLKIQYSSWDQLPKLLLDVSAVVCNCRQLSSEIRQAHLKHRVAIDATTLEIYMLERKQRQKICLQTQFELPCRYPNSILSWSTSTLFGDADSVRIAQAVSQVPPGHLYLTRALAAAEASLAHSKS